MNRFSNYLRLAVVALGLLAAVAPARAEERPIKGSGSGGLYYTPHHSSADLYGHAEVTHLGRTGMYVPLDFYELYDYNNVAPLSFRLLQRSAGFGDNGDILFAAIDADFDPDLGILLATITFTGGTGRFVDATGSASLLIVFDSWPPDPNQNYFIGHSFAIEGTIDY